MTDGTNLAGLCQAHTYANLYANIPAYSKNVGQPTGALAMLYQTTIGITTDGNNSGIMRDAVTTTMNNYQNSRGIIKY